MNDKYQQTKRRYNQSKQGKISTKKYEQSDKGKLTRAKTNAKKRGLGFNPVHDNILNEPYLWHHINKNDVVAIPENIHKIYQAKWINLHGHIFMINQIIEQIYRDDIHDQL